MNAERSGSTIAKWRASNLWELDTNKLKTKAA
jgi:hypothetical protein